jgi:hypothetical protein
MGAVRLPGAMLAAAVQLASEISRITRCNDLLHAPDPRSPASATGSPESVMC